METDFGSVVDALPGLVWTALPDGAADFVNRRWRDYTGLSFEEACGRGWHETIHPDDRPEVVSAWTAFMASGRPGELEARLRRFDGAYRWFLFHASPIRDASGAIVKWCGVNTDIEDRKRAEDAVRVHERRAQLIVDGLPAIVTLMAPDGEFEGGNRRMLDYFGETLEVLKSRPVDFSFHPDDRAQVMALWRRSVETGEPYDHSARLRRADGVYRWFHTLGFPLRDEAGNIAVWYLLQADVDDRKWAETLLAGEKRLLEMVAQGLPLAEILEAVCAVVEAAAPGCLCSILSIDPDGLRFRHGAGPSLPAAYNDVLDGLVMDQDYGPCGMAAQLKTQVVAADTASDPRWASSPWPGLVSDHGLRACWSTPILSRDDRVIGVFALYKREPSSPTPRELDLIRQFTHIASIAIERAQGDQSLRRSEARKAAILDSALDCIVTIDGEGRITEFNPAAERTFGYRESDILGRPLSEVIVPPSQREQHRLGVARYIATGESRVIGRRVEMTAMRADGREFPVELTIARTPFEGAASFTGFLRDITERKRTEEQLWRSNAHLAEAQRVSRTGSFTWNPVSNDYYWSEEMYRIFEYDIGARITPQIINEQRLHPEDRPLIEALLIKAAAGENFDVECRAVMPSGRLKYLRIIGHTERNLKSGPEFLGAIHDVTEHRLAEEALGRARSELARMARITSLGALTASIAHEVNQPLAGIITNANTCLKMLAADPPNVGGAQETARRTVRDGNRAAEVIRRLRALFSKQDVTSEPVDLNDAVREVIALSWSDLQRSRVVARTELTDDLPMADGDRVQLQQVVLNLILNAADAMAEVDDRPRELSIRTWLEGEDRVSLAVTDVGVGLGSEPPEKLFEAFYTTKSEGMGMGLSVSRSIIENHGGRLWAAPNEGPGATFTFCLNRSPEDAGEVLGDPAARPSAADGSQPFMVQR